MLVWTMWGILRQNAPIQRFYMHFEVPTNRLEVPEFQAFRLPPDLPDKCCTAKTESQSSNERSPIDDRTLEHGSNSDGKNGNADASCASDLPICCAYAAAFKWVDHGAPYSRVEPWFGGE